jgi:hypothetical protein
LIFLRPTYLLQEGFHGPVKAKTREVPDQNRGEPGGLPDIREHVEFPFDDDDQPASPVILPILSGISVPIVSLRRIYV